VTGFERPNLTLAVERCRGREEKRLVLERLGREVGLPGIVYVATRKSAELWGSVLTGMGLRTGMYHAGLTDQERSEAQERFLASGVDVIVATNAFGMGVDKPDIRFVAHAELPGSIEAYYQEVGRAGRDGLPSRCTLLFSPADVRTQEFFLAGANPSFSVFREVWRHLGEGLTEDDIQAGGATASGSTPWCATPSPEGVAPGSSTTTSRAVPAAVPRRAVAFATCASAGVVVRVVPSTRMSCFRSGSRSRASAGSRADSAWSGWHRYWSAARARKSWGAVWIESRPTASSRRSHSSM